MQYLVLQSLVGNHPLTGLEVCLRPGDITDWCPTEGPRLVEAGIFSILAAHANPENPETPEASRAKRKTRETR